MKLQLKWIAIFILVFNASAEELMIAVASNFRLPAKEIAARFEQESSHRVTLAFGSTGKHYAQIKNGAPFDLFLAADTLRPALLEKSGVGHNRFTYAIGQLVLWAPQADSSIDPLELIRSSRRIAIANPKLAPYGKAAAEFLKKNKLWEEEKMVMGQNIAQAFQFVKSKSVKVGFVAKSQIAKGEKGLIWELPVNDYPIIEQQAVLLSKKKSALEFMKFIKLAEIEKLIKSSGYYNGSK